MGIAEKDILYQEIDTFYIYCGMFFLSFAQYGHDLHETTSRNFIAHGMSCI